MDSWLSPNKTPQIPIVIDTKTNEPISIFAINLLYAQDELAHIRFHNLKEKRFTCFRCNQIVILACRFDENSPHGHYYFFRHPAGVECEWKYDSSSKAEIYKGTQEGLRHYELKHLIANTLKKLDGWQVLAIDNKFVFSPETHERTKPDVLANFDGNEIAIEIQLRSESPKRILKRTQIHQERGAYILWVTSHLSTDSSDDHNEEGYLKQVHKDIAYSNRGNRYIFDAELARESMDQREFIVKVNYLLPRIEGDDIETIWKSENVKFTDLNLENGNIYFFDCEKTISVLRNKLRPKGLLHAKALLADKKFPSFERFLLKIKSVWPTFDKEEDTYKLKEMYDQEFSKRQLQLKNSIIKYFRSPAWRDKGNEFWWKEMAATVKEYNFGVNTNCDIRVIEKLLLILGIPLSEYLCVEHKSHIQACHYFFDKKSFIPYVHLCRIIISESVYEKEILKHSSIKSRFEQAPSVVDALTDLDSFVKWFISEPKVHPI